MSKPTKKVEAFLAKIKEEKIEQLLGIAMDTRYWKSIADKIDVENLRTLLGNERAKGKNKSDLKVIENLSIQIANHEKSGTELTRLDGMRKAITVYFNFIVGVSKGENEETLAELEEVASL